ncbi:MAG: fimbrillin family protein [Bacteroidaceae bacterium]|nr:fimbrillin family protein [Bacteroidaceae bacterium]
MRNNHTLSILPYIFVVPVLMVMIEACSEDSFSSMISNDLRHPIHLSSVYPSVDVLTRATIDGGFVSGDAMGIFVVDRNADGEAETPTLGSGRASNMKFTLGEDGTWKGSAQLYWDPKGAAADFYGYYPFDENMSSVTNYEFTINPQQRAEGTNGYNASDLLYARKENVEQTVETISLQYKHLMAGVMVRLEMGTGFSSTEWTELEKTVLLRNTITTGHVNLATGEVQVSTESESKDILPLTHNGTWRAITYPQTVASGKTLISVTIDGQSYALKKDVAMTFLSGKMHTFTITVDRHEAGGQFTFSFSDEAITPWAEDAELHEGLVREYVVVEVSAPGNLAKDLAKMGQDYTSVEGLKIIGTVNQSDIDFLSEMRHLTDLNMQKCIIEGGVLAGLGAATQMPVKHFVFPEKGVKTIGYDFLSRSNLSGSLMIPEGVERIEEAAFSECKFLTGALSLPSTLKYIGSGVLQYSNIHSELRLPDGLEEFHGLGGFYTGEYYIPSSMRYMSSGLPTTLTGTLYFPQGLDLGPIGGFLLDGCQCTSAVFPEGMTGVPRLVNSELRGEVKLPSTVTRIGGMAFMNTKITKIIFPENLRELDDSGYLMEEGIFAGSRLMGTIELPKKVGRIPRSCFRDCVGITGLVFPEGVLMIDEYAFAGCISLNGIVCESEEPPLVAGNAFLGVPKDNFTVEVPKGCVERYRNARGWSDFKRFAEYSNFVCRPAQVCALNSVHSEDMVLNADGPWTVARRPDWCTLSKESGTGKTALTINILPLSHGAGARVDTLVFTMQSGGKTIETSCVLRQYDYEHEEDSYIMLQKATKGNNGGIDIVFAGDGFDGASIADGSYLDLVEYQTECFFAVEPYRSMRKYFNVYVTFPLSQEKGVNTMYTYVNNRFGTLYGMNELTISDITSTALITESDEVMDYVVEKTPVKRENLWRTVTILVPNSTDYDGNTEFMENGAALSICPPSDKPYPKDTRGIIQHEAGGHGFGKLGDEEIVCNKFAPLEIKRHVEDMHRRGWYQNLATTGKLSQVPWAEFIFDPAYSDYVDVYEGGYGFTRGIYRPEANSCMNYGIPYFNTPSRLAIYCRIKEYASEGWSMDEFRAQDTFEWGPTMVTRANESDLEGLVTYANGNHIQPRIMDFKRIGDEVRSIRLKLKNERMNK